MEAVKYNLVITFLSLKSCTPKNTFDEMKEVYIDDALSYDTPKHWHYQFKWGWSSLETAPIFG